MYHIKDVGSFTDINGFLKLQGDIRVELEEDRRCAHCTGRFADNCSGRYEIRHGMTLFRSTHNPIEGKMNMEYNNFEKWWRAFQKTYISSMLPCTILELMERISASLPSYRAIREKMSPSCAWTVMWRREAYIPDLGPSIMLAIRRAICEDCHPADMH